MRFTVEEYPTAWQFLEIGIVKGWTISKITFAVAANLLVKAVEKKRRGLTLASDSKQPPTRVLMADMMIMAKSVVERRWMLVDLENLFTWNGITCKPAKSRSLIVRRDRLVKIVFQILNETIPTILKTPFIS